MDYGTLEIKAGGAAVDAYSEATAPGVSETQRAAIGDALREYCKRDTWAMVVLLAKLRGEGLAKEAR